METFDFDRHFRRMELAVSDAEVKQLAQELRVYLMVEDPSQKQERMVAWKQALIRLEYRSAIELATFRELMGKPVIV